VRAEQAILLHVYMHMLKSRASARNNVQSEIMFSRDDKMAAEEVAEEEGDLAAAPAEGLLGAVSPSTTSIELANIGSMIIAPAAQSFILITTQLPLSWRATAINTAAWLHCCASVTYHWRCAFGLDRDRLENHFRRADQALIHLASVVWGWALSDSTVYGCLLLAYHVPCIVVLWRPKSTGVWTRLRLLIGIIGYLSPLTWRGQVATFCVAVAIIIVSSAVLLLSPMLDGWGHPLFHLGLIPFGMVLQCAALSDSPALVV